MAQLFISYSTRNADFARYLRSLLQDAGFDVWMDETKLSAGQSWTDTLEANVTNCAAFVIIMSPESKASDWVRRERLLAEKLHKPMFPILLAGEAWWDLANIQYEDMRAGVKASLSPRMIDALRRAISGEVAVAESEPTGSHTPVPMVAQTDSRKLEAAMPAETKAGSDTEVWAKISLPSSEGLRGELPVVVPSGDVIQKGDARASSFPIRFPVDARTGQRMPAQAELRLSAGDFLIAAPGERIEVEIPPDSDSRTVIFTLEAKPQGKTSGRSRIVIDLIYEAKIIAQISVSTVLVERVTAAVPTWTLAAAYVSPNTGEIAPGAFAPETGTVSPETGEISESTLHDAPIAQPTVSTSSQAPVATPEPSDSREQREEKDRGAFGATVPAADDYVDGDDVLPTYDEDSAKKIAAADDYVPQPATPQYSGSATRSPMGAPYVAMPGRIPRRASNTPLRLASLFAALALVFVVVLAITQQSGNPLNVNGSATAALATQFALLPTDSVNDTITQQAATSIAATLNAQAVGTFSDLPNELTVTALRGTSLAATALSNPSGDIAVAPLANCAGSPGSDLVGQMEKLGFKAVLLDHAITNKADALRSSRSPIIVWGECSRAILTLNFELAHAPLVGATAGFTGFTTTSQPEALRQSDSRAVRVTQAVTEYTFNSANYTALAQTFEDLAASATSADERNALRRLQSNSVYLAGVNSLQTPAAR